MYTIYTIELPSLPVMPRSTRSMQAATSVGHDFQSPTGSELGNNLRRWVEFLFNEKVNY